MPAPDNRAVFSAAEVVAAYVAKSGLTPAEEYLFQKYLGPGMRILDLGVGAGRTTPYLSGIAGEYLAADFAEPMVVAVKRAFPQQQVMVMNAAEPWPFPPGSLDAVVFAFNGIDCIVPDEARRRFLQYCRGCLRERGVLIFSTHNARCLFPWWVAQARTLPGRVYLSLRNAWDGMRYGAALALTRAPWRGDGYFRDPVHGGMIAHAATAQFVIRETTAQGFALLETVGSEHPQRRPDRLTPWNYFVFTKTAPAA